eukprot:gene24647-32098_t
MNTKQEDDRTQRDNAFLNWLQEGGAEFNKILWPSSATNSGIRGAIATDNISPMEYMIVIPGNLMISPPIILENPEIGQLLKASMDILQGDILLAVFMMHETLKGDKSFYAPFLRILPEPSNISEWTDSQLNLLQDTTLFLRAKNRRNQLTYLYNRAIGGLNRRYPENFPLVDYSLKLFKFCWNSVQARAFGRRLPWSAMVPFADCLNHSNVQTKYDFNIDGNNTFSGKNHYPKGAEVFNSYGRRANENLLQDYGFAMLNNDARVCVPISCPLFQIDLLAGLAEDDSNLMWKRQILFELGLSPRKVFRINACGFPFEMLTFLRVAVLSNEEVNLLKIDPDYHSESEASQRGEEEKNEVEDGKELPLLMRQKRTSSLSRIFYRIVSQDTELRALRALKEFLVSLIGNMETTSEQDEITLADLEHLRFMSTNKGHSDAVQETIEKVGTSEFDFEYDTEMYWKTISAVKYRLTRKRIAHNGLRMIDKISAYLERAGLNNSNIKEKDIIHIDDVYGGADSDSQRSLIYKVELHEYLINISDRESWIIKK